MQFVRTNSLFIRFISAQGGQLVSINFSFMRIMYIYIFLATLSFIIIMYFYTRQGILHYYILKSRIFPKLYFEETMKNTSKYRCDIGAFVLFFKQRVSLNATLDTFRTYNPTSSIVIVNDGGVDALDIARTYNATYFYGRNLKMRGVSVHITIKWLQRFFSSIQLIHEAFFVMHEEDVLYTRAFNCSKLKNDMNGYNPAAVFVEPITSILHSLNPNSRNKTLFSSGCGGTILRTSFFKKIGLGKWQHVLLMVRDVLETDSPILGWGDIALSILCWAFNGTIGPHDEFLELHTAEDHRRFQNGAAAVVHNYRKFYI